MKYSLTSKHLLTFNSDDKAKAEETFKSKWAEFRNALANNEFSYDQTDKALNNIFLKQFDKLFQSCGKELLAVSLKDVFDNHYIGRGAVLHSPGSTSYERFIPDAKFIKHDNRFSPPNIEWLYLAIGDSEEHIKKCSEAECGVRNGIRFGFCHFNLNSDYDDIKIVDLTKYIDSSYDEINTEYQHTFESIINDTPNGIKPITDAIAKGKKIESPHQIISNFRMKAIGEFIQKRDLWFLKTHSKMLSELIFIPIEGSDKKLEYTPFQTMAKYFEGQGFGGIIYKSTRYPNAKNLVLFDKNYANPFGTIEDYVIE